MEFVTLRVDAHAVAARLVLPVVNVFSQFLRYTFLLALYLSLFLIFTRSLWEECNMPQSRRVQQYGIMCMLPRIRYCYRSWCLCWEYVISQFRCSNWYYFTTENCPDCSGHGKCDYSIGLCICDPPYDGPSCSIKLHTHLFITIIDNVNLIRNLVVELRQPWLGLVSA